MPKGRKWSIADASKLAESKYGVCLSKKYLNVHEPLKWQCSKGHQWMASFGNIRRGGWCPHCSITHRHSLEFIQKLAEKKGGKCLTNQYKSRTVPMLWVCEKKHKWKAPASHILAGSWCPKCYGRGKTIAEMQKVARKNKGRCLSEEYNGMHEPLRWECKVGHVWKAPPVRIIHRNHWCPQCSHTNKKGKSDMIALAKKRKGKFLSPKYQDRTTKYDWQCEKGHIWKANYNSIRKSWCPECALEKRRVKQVSVKRSITKIR